MSSSRHSRPHSAAQPPAIIQQHRSSPTKLLTSCRLAQVGRPQRIQADEERPAADAGAPTTPTTPTIRPPTNRTTPPSLKIGTPYYMSPEIWANKPYNGASNIWALGCTLYELAALRPPFLGDSFPQLKRAVVSGRYPSLPRHYSQDLTDVIGKMLNINPQRRPTCQSLLDLPEVSLSLSLTTPSTHQLTNLYQPPTTNVHTVARYQAPNDCPTNPPLSPIIAHSRSWHAATLIGSTSSRLTKWWRTWRS